MNNDKHIDAVLLVEKQKNYLFPLLTLVEVTLLSKKMPLIYRDNLILMPWRNVEIPFVSFDSLTLNKMELRYQKIVVVHAIFSSDHDFPPFFAIGFQGQIQRVSVTSENITWLDSLQSVAQMDFEGKKIDVIIPNFIEWAERIVNLERHSDVTK